MTKATFKTVDFSAAATAQAFTYDSKTGAIRQQGTGSLVGAANTQDGGTRIQYNGKELTGARVAWILATGRDIPVGHAVIMRERTPGHYGNRLNNLYIVDVVKNPEYFE